MKDIPLRGNLAVRNYALCRPFELPDPSIRNSSILWPDFIAATSQRGRLPRPDQVSEVCGLRYFGNTLGYLRCCFPFIEPESAASTPPSTPRLRIARRFSNSYFSALIRVDKMALTFS